MPSGALADQIGRKRMVVLAATCMVVEMLFFAFAPSGSSWLFPMLLLNRILSGAAEAAASGADESLAYDSLSQEGRAGDWPAVLARMMRWQSAAFFVTMLLGALAYDPKTMEWIFGSSISLSSATAIRMPLYLTLANAVLALVVALAMREPSLTVERHPTIGTTIRQTLGAGRWILTTPVVLFLILAGLCMDSVIRLFMTVGSNYYRLIATTGGFVWRDRVGLRDSRIFHSPHLSGWWSIAPWWPTSPPRRHWRSSALGNVSTSH